LAEAEKTALFDLAAFVADGSILSKNFAETLQNPLTFIQKFHQLEEESLIRTIECEG